MTADLLPLGDLRVIDVTIARAGPTCVRQLADWGADVVRVESPAAGRSELDRHGSDFQNLHRNKRAIAIDLKHPDGVALLLRMVEQADVLVENLRPAVKHRLGIDYETVRRRNPASCTRRSRASGKTAPTRRAAVSTRSPRAWAG